MSSWCADVKCKEKFRDSKDMISISAPMLDHFDYTSDKEYIQNIEDFMGKFAANYIVLTVDLDKELLLLVKVADENIKRKPFLYAAQRISAVKLLCIPFKELEKVEKVIAPKVAHVKTIFIYNTGRCGSTLLCKALDQLPNVQSISEANVYNVLALHYEKKFSAFPDAELSHEALVTVTRVATILLNYYFLVREPKQTNICYKHIAETIDGAKLLHKAVPNAKNIYMYRNCLNFAESCTRFVLGGNYNSYWLLSALRLDALYMWWRFNFSRPKENRWFYNYMGNTTQHEKSPFRHGFYWCFGYYWWINVYQALGIIQNMPNFFSVILKYEDLVERKEELVFQIADSVGLLEDVKSRRKMNYTRQLLSNVFTSNSQTGSVLASKRNLQDTDDVWFGEWEKREINNVLQYLGIDGQDGAFILPGTL